MYTHVYAYECMSSWHFLSVVGLRKLRPTTDRKCDLFSNIL